MLIQLRNLALVASALTLICAQAAQSFAVKSIFGIKTPYQKIDDYLVEHLPDSKDCDENFAEARKWLDQKLSAHKKPGSLTLALEAFVDLDKLRNDKACDMATMEPLARIEQELAAEKYQRIDKVVDAVANEKANSCKQIHSDRFLPAAKSAMTGTFGTLISGLVENHLQLILPKKLIPHGREPIQFKFAYISFFRAPLKVNEFKSKDCWIIKKLEEMSKDDPEFNDCLKPRSDEQRSKLHDTSKIEALVKKYVVEPCEAFVKAQSIDNIIYDLAALEGLKDHQDTPEDISLYRYIADYKICRHLAINGEYAQMVQAIASYLA